MSEVNKEDVEQFIREMKSVAYYSSKIRDINLSLEEVSVKLQGVSSPAMKEVIYENAGNPYSNNKLSMMQVEEELIHKRDYWIKEIERIDEVFSLIENQEDFDVKQCMIDIYVCKIKYDDAIIKYSLVKSTIHRNINKSVRKAMLQLVPQKNVII